jgi:hypothetical protein
MVVYKEDIAAVKKLIRCTGWGMVEVLMRSTNNLSSMSVLSFSKTNKWTPNVFKSMCQNHYAHSAMSDQNYSLRP